MKTFTITTLIALCFLSFQLTAQPGGKPPRDEKRKDRIEAMKIGYLTERLNLSSEEAKSFWPVYNQFQNELDAARKSRKKDMRDAQDDFMNMPDKEVEKLIDNEIIFRQTEVDILKKYHAQFKQVLPIKKVAMLYRTEEDFKRELLHRIKERRDMK